jgi:hypothetical protein
MTELKIEPLAKQEGYGVVLTFDKTAQISDGFKDLKYVS